jgi:hypothetical protein
MTPEMIAAIGMVCMAIGAFAGLWMGRRPNGMQVTLDEIKEDLKAIRNNMVTKEECKEHRVECPLKIELKRVEGKI